MAWPIWESLFRVVLIIPRMVNKCLGKLVGMSHGLMGEVKLTSMISFVPRQTNNFGSSHEKRDQYCLF